MYDNLNQVTSEFEDKAKKLACGNGAWIFKATGKAGVPELLAKLDTIISNMPDSEIKKLKTRFIKIIPDGSKKYIREYDDQFLDAVVEVLGWGWLKERYPSYSPQFSTTPDLLVKNRSDQVMAAMECKKKRHSEEEACWLQHHRGKVIKGKVNAGITSSDYNKNPLLRSLRDTLSTAEQQVTRIEAPDKFIFLDLSLDLPFMLPEVERQLVCSVLGIASELCQKGILLVSFKQYQVDRPITGAGLP